MELALLPDELLALLFSFVGAPFHLPQSVLAPGWQAGPLPYRPASAWSTPLPSVATLLALERTCSTWSAFFLLLISL